MLISLYHIEANTKRWYINIFWHLVDTYKVNAWFLYTRHYEQMGLPARKRKSLMNFSCEIAKALIYAKKGPEKPTQGRPSKRASLKCAPNYPLSVADVCYDNIAHWPAPTHDKKRCKVCHAMEELLVKNAKCRYVSCLTEITQRHKLLEQ
eukprot:gene17041-8550_t